MKAWMAPTSSRVRRVSRSLSVLVALVAVAAGLPRSAVALDGTWTATSSGTWATGSNWQGGIVGTGTGFTATFAPDITSDVTVTNNQQRAIGGLVFGTVGGTGAGAWIITGSNLVLNNNVTGPANATITVHSASATLDTVIASTTANNPVIVKAGTGTLILTASTTLSSKFSVTAGTLQISNNNQLGANPGTFTADQLAISNGATLRTTAAVTLGTNRGITIGSGGGTLSINGGGLTYAGRLTGSGNTATVTGASPLTLENTTGTPTDVNWDFASNSGIRTFFQGRNALGTGSVLVRNGVRLTSQSMTTGTISNAVTLDSGAGLTARSSGGGQTYTNVIFPATGTVVFNKDDQTTSNLTISSGGALTGNLTVDTTQGGTNAVGSVFLDGVFSGEGGLVKSGTGASGRVVLRGANTYSGTTRITTGTLQLGDGGTTGSLSPSSVITGAAGATLAFNRSDTIVSGSDFNSVIAGGIGVTQLGSGTVILAGTNTYTGKTSIANGTLEISAAGQLGGNPASFVEDQLTISNGGTLRTTAAVTLNNRGVVIGSGGGRLDINGAAMSYAGRFTGPGETLAVTGAHALTISNTTGVASSVNWDFASNSGVRTFFRGSNALGTGTVTVRNGVRLVSEVTAPTGGQVDNAVTLDSGAGISARSSAGAVTYTNVTLPTTGTVTFNRDDQVTAALTIASGRELTGILTVDTSQQISGTAVGDVTLSGIFSGAGGLEKTGTGASGRLILAGANTYTGPTTVSAGVLALGTNGAIASSPLVKVESGATFNVTQKVGGYAVPAGQTLAGSGTVAGDVSFGTGATLAPGASPGTLTITGNSIFAPGGNYNWQVYDAAGMAGSPAGWDLADIGGVLDVAATTESPFAINLWSLSGVGPDVDGNALNFSATTSGTWRIATAAGGITNFEATKFTINTSAANGTAGFSNPLSGGAFSLVQAGNDINLVFTSNAAPLPTSLTWYGDGVTEGGSGAWSTSGTTWFDGSAVRTWEPASTAVFGGSTAGTVTLDTGVSANNGLEFATSGYTVAGSGLTLGGTANAISVAAAATATISAPLAGTAGFAKSGAGTLALAGANTVSGAVAVDAGRLDMGDGGTTGSLGIASGVAVASGAVFAVNRSDNVSQGTDFPVISGSGGFVQAGSGTLTLSGSNSYTGETTIHAGAIAVPTGGAISGATLMMVGQSSGDSATLNVTGGSVTNQYGYIGYGGGSVGAVTVSGGSWSTDYLGIGWGYFGASSGTLTMSGGSVSAATAILGGNTPGVGTVTVGGGVFSVTDQFMIGMSGTGILNVTGGSVISGTSMLGGDSNSVGTATVTGGTWANSGDLVVGNLGTGTLTMSGGLVSVAGTLSKGASGTINLNSGGTLQIGVGGTTGVLGVAALTNNGTLVFDRSDASTYSGVISGAGAVVKQGAGTLTLSGSNNYTGSTVVAAGRLVGTSTSLQGPITNNAAVTFDQPTNGTYAGVMSGSGSLTKTGAGALTLAANNTYSGPTVVSAGTLRVDADQSAATGAVTVASGATLAGTGTVGGATTIQSGATVSPGASPGTLTFTQGHTWAGGGNYAWQIHDAAGTAGSATGWDLVNVGGVLDVAATSGDKFNINLWSLSAVGPDANGSAINFSATSSGTWRIATAAGGITGFDAAKFAINTSATNGTGGFANSLSGGTFSLVQQGNDVNLVFTPGLNPNPTTLTWYGDGVNPGGTGTWDATANTWFDGTAVRPWVPGAKAIFTGSAGTVTLGSGISADGGIQFASTGFTLSGVGLTLGGTANAVEVAPGATATVSAPLAGTAGLAKTGAGTLSLAAANTLSGVTLVQSGTVVVANGGATATSPVTVQAGAALKIDPAVTMRAPSLTLSGSGARLDGAGATILVNGTAGIGQLAITSGTVTGRPSLTVSGSGQVALPTDFRFVMDLTALAIEQASGGKLDIGKGRINIGIGGITEADLRADIISGRSGGTFSGTSGIMTTGGKASATSPNPVVGYRVFTTGSAAVAWAAFGDTNLDGQVTPTDISLINQGGKFGQGPSTGSVWFQGDYNYSGGVTTTDISLINQANLFAKGSYLPVANQSTGFGGEIGTGGGLGARRLSSLGGTTLIMGVPEPSTWALAGIGLAMAAAAAGRRRYRGLATGRRP